MSWCHSRISGMTLNNSLAGKEVIEPPSDYLMELGRVVVRWNLLESYLDFTLIRLLGKEITEGRAHALFIHMAIPQKLDVLSTLIDELAGHYPHLETGYKVAGPKLKEAQRRRNSLVHAKWGKTDDGNVKANTISARGKLKWVERIITISEIQEASNAIYDAIQSLYELAWDPGRRDK